LIANGNPVEELNSIRKEEDALDQSIALNRVVMTLLENKKREDFWLRIVLIISLLANIAIAGIFTAYESQWTTTTTTTTITQDTGEGTGNNVYQSGENATYTQGDHLEEGLTDGTADNNNYYNDSDANSD
jgi:hypothetical protein